MDRTARERLRKRLLDLKTEILSEGDLDVSPAHASTPDARSDEDTQPLAEMSQSIASSRNRNRAAVLARVTAALARLEDDPDTFGLCADCEEPIPPKRLDLMPYVELCVDCQQAADGPRTPTTRRHLRDFRS